MYVDNFDIYIIWRNFRQRWSNNTNIKYAFAKNQSTFYNKVIKWPFLFLIVLISGVILWNVPNIPCALGQ